MASSLDISKIKLKENGNSYYSTFQIKDNVSRTQKMDKINPNGSGYFKMNAGDKAPGANSISLGYRNNATGNCAAAIGSQNLAAGDFSFAAGIGTKTISAYQFVLGEYNEPLDLDILEIGNGSNDTARSNLLRITKDGNFYIAGDILYGGTKDTQSPISLTSKLKDIESKIVQNEYTLPVATRSSLGGVKIGSNIDLDKDGTISVTFPDSSLYELPPADKETLGGVIIGDNIEVDENGKISVIFPSIPEEYTLPTASATTLGGIKVAVAAGFRVDSDGVLNFAVNKMDQNNPQGSGYIKMNTSGNAGLYSVSLGNNNKAEGENSIALGKNNISSKSNSISLGIENTSGGENSIIIGSQSKVNANNSFSIGINSTVNGTESFTIGKDLESNYDGQFVIGKYNENKEENYFELGIGSISNRKNALAITTEGKAYFLNDILVKNADDTYTNIAAAARDYINNPYKLPVASSTTLGGIKVGNNLEIDEDGVLSATIKPVLDNIECTGYFSHNRVNTTTIGKNSFASNSSALAYKSTAFGENTIAGVEKTATREIYNEETQSYETEEYTFIDGRASFSEGYNTIAGGIYSHAAGNNTIANDAYQFVIGSYNNNNENNLFEVGNGADENNRSNAFSIGRDGNVSIAGELTANGQKIAPTVEIETQQEYDNLLLEDKMKDIIYLIKENNKLYYKDKNYGGGGSAEDIKILTRTDDFIPTEIENTYSGWIEDQEGAKISPNTLLESVQDKDGNNLEYILNNLEAKNIIYDDKTTLFNTTNVQNAIEIVDARAKNHSLIAPAFVPGQIYNIGDYVTYNNKLYKSKVNTQASVYKLPIVDASGSGNGQYYYSHGASSETYTKYTSDDAYGGYFKNTIFICSKTSGGVTLRRGWDGMKYYAYQDTFVYNGEIWYAILFNVGYPNVATNYPFKRITELENFDIDVSKNIPTQELVTTFLDLATGNSFDTTAWEEVTVISEIKDEAKEILYDDTKSQLGVNNVQSAIEYLVENGGSSVTVDKELNENSDNPIANSTVTKLFKNSFYNSENSSVISDVNISGGSNNYSTEEHKIGTWIDGSDIYEKTYCPVVSGVLEEDFSNKEIIESSGYMNYTNNNKISIGNPWGCIYKSSANKLIIESYNASFDFTYQYNHVTVRYIYRKE